MSRRSILAWLLAILVLAYGAFVVGGGLLESPANADLAVVLGNEVLPNGRLSTRLAARVDRAIELYNEHRCRFILMSGAAGPGGYDEPGAMVRYAVAHGVPAAALLSDPKGNNTWATAENTARTVRNRGFDGVLIVSQYYHLARCRLAFAHAGVPIRGTAYARYIEWKDVPASLRELVAYAAYFVRSRICAILGAAKPDFAMSVPLPSTPVSSDRQAVFVSHSSLDRDVMLSVVGALETGSGIQCWFAPRDVHVGSPYSGQLSAAIKTCDLFLLLLSPEAVVSPHVLREVDLGVHYRREMLVVQLGAVVMGQDLEYYLRVIQTLKLSTPLTPDSITEVVQHVRRKLTLKAKGKSSGAQAAFDDLKSEDQELHLPATGLVDVTPASPEVETEPAPELRSIVDKSNQILVSQPGDIDALSRRAAALEELRSYDEAIADLDLLIQLRPDDPEARMRRGRVRRRSGKLELALRDHTRAIELQPRQANYHFERGLTYYASQRYNRAITDFSMVISLDPRHALGFARRADSLRKVGRREEAFRDYSHALEVKPDAADFRIRRGILSYEQRRFGAAIDDFSAALKINPGDVDAILNRALAYRKLRRYDHALQDYNEAIRLAPGDADAYRGRARVHEAMGSLDLAEGDRGRAQAIDATT
jgi:tetratricopeptide (TPR) repeat protein/vancomycin permeability regulator SanA